VSLDESDLRLANRGGARISAAEIAAILERRGDRTRLVPSHKRDLDRNGSVLHEIQRELASREYRLTEVRILDVLIWSQSAAT
jgi:hypothetical protein